MNTREIIAFYRVTEKEIGEHAERFAACYGLRVRYEKYPPAASTVSVLVGEDTVLCMFCLRQMKFRRLLRYVYAVNRPALLFDREDSAAACTALKLPVGYSRENKEKAAWANFFLRNSRQAEAELVIPYERDEGIAGMVRDNADFIEKVFAHSGVNYRKRFADRPIERLLEQLFQGEEKSLVLVMLPSRVFSFFIPYYLRLYKRSPRTQVLLIPRDESLYVPCH